MKMLTTILAGLALLCAVGILTSTVSYGYYQPPALFAFNPTGEATLAVSTNSARVALGSTGASSPQATTAIIQNYGAANAYVVFGNSSVVATSAVGMLVPAGNVAATPLAIGNATYIAAITAASSTNLSVSTGY